MKNADHESDPIDQYISSFAPRVRAILRKIRATVRRSAPDAEERISYRMPAAFQDGAVVYYGAFKNHVGLFPPVRDSRLTRRLAKYAGPKGNLQFPLDEPVPFALIGAVVKARLEENRARKAARARR